MQAVADNQHRSRLPRYKRVEGYPAIVVGRPKHAILEAVGRYRYLTAYQLAALLFSPSSRTYVQEHCKELFHAGYLFRLFLPGPKPVGSPRTVYALDNKGQAYLRRLAADGLGAARSFRFRAAEEAEKEMPFLTHAIEGNSLLVSAERLARAQEEVTLGAIRTEKEMRRDPIRVQIVIPMRKPQEGRGKAEKVAVIPDGWVDLRYRGAQQCIAFELDRGTQEVEAIQRKIYGYLKAFEGGYAEKFGTRSVTVAFVVRGSPWSRVERLKSWTEEALTLKGKQDYADLFRFSSFDPLSTDPAQVFFSPLWFQPFTRSGVPLLERG